MYLVASYTKVGTASIISAFRVVLSLSLSVSLSLSLCVSLSLSSVKMILPQDIRKVRIGQDSADKDSWNESMCCSAPPFLVRRTAHHHPLARSLTLLAIARERRMDDGRDVMSCHPRSSECVICIPGRYRPGSLVEEGFGICTGQEITLAGMAQLYWEPLP
ncbi:hypothetical protein F4803DRAFT_448562 [Xylaria telfairii]|nr:hypothetical protein F4803DRAFT_448562 [Xylaria telfairii]